MVDSGAHGLFTHLVRKGHRIDESHRWDWKNYESDAFKHYAEYYIQFLKEYKHLLDYYITIDAIYEPEISYRWYRYLKDEHGLDPIPVYHYNEPLKYFEKYLQETDYVAISGLGQGIPKDKYIKWADSVFDIVCDNKGALPKYKIHGLALTSLQIIMRYPFYSVDSSTWVRYAQFGKIMLPKVIRGERRYDVIPNVIHTSTRSPYMYNGDIQHFHNLSKTEQKFILTYLKELGIKYGKSHFKTVDKDYTPKKHEKTWGKPKDGKRTIEVIKEYGVSNRHEYRCLVNMIFFCRVEHFLKWPRPWQHKKKKFMRIL